MRALVVLPVLALALGACAGPVAVPASPAQPAVGAAKVDCRWDDDRPGARPLAELEGACEKDPACGCATLGHTLLMASDGAIGVETLDALERSCQHGVVFACSETALVEEMCVRGTARPSPACDVLTREGHLGHAAAEMQAH